MVALSVDVEDFIVGFHEGLVRSTWKVEGYVKEVSYGFCSYFSYKRSCYYVIECVSP